MSGQWRYSTRRERLPANWGSTRRRILARDGYRCTESHHEPECDGTATDVDHVRRDGGEGDENLRALSGPCHRAKSSREGVDARESSFRSPERHPGLLR